ncbi:CBS domain-containing protein [Halanaeroarchaeum sulfurireducens]|uniref:CBS domain-containing protein n=1 Tax=Halanaeroarchaeum sulfurireducens TaxID=1604004 RepID=A0A0F7PC48_9EURY|nr:CBS domain-containing protein [Halanaeroarchaeum sulfurireducens]AKH97730.1 CBS domain-containing protein [Halanaeroarchaeum sulfurireducens]ALG82125.1 CBS domain-containing protein [Halanaeroarchaeum sulfurireducens]
MPPLVEDLMADDPIAIGVDASVRDAGTRLYEAAVGSLIVTSEKDVPVGIVTSTDVFRVMAETDASLSEISVSEYMSRPLLTVEADAPIRRAVRRMNEEEVEQLAIVEDYDVIGVLSRGDVIDAYEDLIKAAHVAERQPES